MFFIWIKQFNSNQYIFIDKIKYTYVDMSLNDGLGDVTIKNKTLLKGELLGSYLTAISHSNKLDWWVIQPKENSNIYYKILIIYYIYSIK